MTSRDRQTEQKRLNELKRQTHQLRRQTELMERADLRARQDRYSAGGSSKSAPLKTLYKVTEEDREEFKRLTREGAPGEALRYLQKAQGPSILSVILLFIWSFWWLFIAYVSDKTPKARILGLVLGIVPQVLFWAANKKPKPKGKSLGNRGTTGTVEEDGKAKKVDPSTIVGIGVGAFIVIFFAIAMFSFTIGRNRSNGQTHPTYQTGHSQQQPSPPSAVSPSAGGEDATVVTPSAEKPEDLAERLPYEGMSEEWIDETYLGAHDEDADITFQGRSSTNYYWHAHNGSGDIVVSVVCQDGVVASVLRRNRDRDYWPDGSTLPDLDASGELKPEFQTPDGEFDPIDYDSPEEYADDAETWFAEHGYSDPWDAAYSYWEDNAGW